MSRAPSKRGLGVDVLTAARARVAWTFDTFPHVYLSGPSGKDSGVMLHIAAQEARRRGRRLGVLYIDLEAQYAATIDYVRAMLRLYADAIDPRWVALPLRLRNAVSMAEPYWLCWDPARRGAWVREPEPGAITDPAALPFYRPPAPGDDCRREAMEFEEFIAAFGHWYGRGEATACLVGIRADESLNRWRAIAKDRKSRVDGRCYTAWKGGATYNVYPIYDWRTEDLWTYVAREELPYNALYDRMHEAGLTVHQMRICQPYGDDQRKGLHLFHVIEPETWARVVARVAGANAGALYAQEAGNILGNRRAELPPGHTWRSFARLILDSLPDHEREHYEDKVAVFLRWYETHPDADGRVYPRGEIPDEADPRLEAARKAPSWRRIVKVLLKNDRLCKGLSFTQQNSSTAAHQKYKAVMKKRRQSWRNI